MGSIFTLPIVPQVRAPVFGRFGWFLQLIERVGEVVVGAGVMWICDQRTLEGGAGGFAPADLAENEAKVVTGIAKVVVGSYQIALAHGPAKCYALPTAEQLVRQVAAAKAAGPASSGGFRAPDGRAFLATRR